MSWHHSKLNKPQNQNQDLPLNPVSFWYSPFLTQRHHSWPGGRRTPQELFLILPSPLLRPVSSQVRPPLPLKYSQSSSLVSMSLPHPSPSLHHHWLREWPHPSDWGADAHSFIYLFIYLLATMLNMWDLNSLTRDWTQAPLHWKAES